MNKKQVEKFMEAVKKRDQNEIDEDEEIELIKKIFKDDEDFDLDEHIIIKIEGDDAKNIIEGLGLRRKDHKCDGCCNCEKEEDSKMKLKKGKKLDLYEKLQDIEDFNEDWVKKDSVNHPDHYKAGDFECIDVMVEALGIDLTIDFCLGNAFKYLFRSKDKGGHEDILKAAWYLNKYKELSMGENNVD